MTKKHSLMIVEDDEDLCESYSKYFQIKGYEIVAVAYNGLEAIKLLETKKPDFMILDTLMSGNDGYFVIKELQNFENIPKVIVVTGCEKCEYENIDGFFRKPVSVEKIEQCIQNLM